MTKFSRTLLAALCALSSGSALAEEVFRYTDDQGRTRYTNRPPTEASTPVQLPPVPHVPFRMTNVPETCRMHGGIDCATGPDADGSVVCRDGYRHAANRFTFSCHEARLEIADIREKGGAYSAFVRNTSGVEAKEVKVEYKPRVGGGLQLEGPSSIPAFEAGEYTISLHRSFVKPNQSNLLVRCANCP